MRTVRTVVGLLLMVGIAACAREERPAPARASSTAPLIPPPPQTPRPSEAGFVAENGSIDLFVIRSSDLALQRSSSPRVREFAQTMIQDHKGASAQLSLEGRRLNLLPSATLQPSEEAMLDELQGSSRFDADYIRDQRIVHQRIIALDISYAGDGRSPTLRPLAAAALPVEQRHLRLLAYL